MTNADRIRAMTDKEIVSWIREHTNCEDGFECPAYERGCFRNCTKHLIDWLNRDMGNNARKPTIADKFRAMSDVELAEFIEYAECYKPNGISFYEWLRQEVSE